MDNHDAAVVALDDILEIIGFGKFHWLILFTCSLLLMLIINETMGMAIIAPASQCDLETDAFERTIITAAPFMGIILSAYLWGFFCDIVGRRRLLIYSIFFSNITSFLSILMTNFIAFVISRFLTGIFVAGAASITLLYMSEFCTYKLRAVVVNYMSMFNGVSMIYCPGVANLLIADTRPFQVRFTWRVLGFIYMIPGVFALLLLLLLPESPEFLLSVEKQVKAFAVLERICHINTGKSLSEFNIFKVEVTHKRENTSAARLSSYKPHFLINSKFWKLLWHEAAPLFQPTYLFSFLLSCSVMLGLFMVANGMGLWFTDMRNNNNLVLESLRFSNKVLKSNTVCGTLNYASETHIETNICNDRFINFSDSIILGIVFIICYILLGLLLLLLPRKIIFIIPLIIAGCCGICLLWLENKTATVICFVLFLALPGVVSNLLASSLVDFIPTFLRGKAMCFCAILGRLGAVIGTILVGCLLEKNCQFIFAFFAVILFICALLGIFLPL